MQTIDQQYSESVRKQVLEIQRKPKAEYTKYGAMSHKLPILIHTAGLLQALEFVNSREKDPIHKQLLEDLAITVGQQNAVEFLKAVREAELSRYMLLTRQVLAALLWYKRFAQSILDVVDGSVEPKEQKETKNHA